MGFQWQHSLVQTFKDYCNNTTLHGFQYLVEPKRSKLEKFVWFVVLLISIVGAVYLFFLMSVEFAKTPTVITLETSNYPIDQVQFPGLAICDVNRISKKAARAFANERYTRLNLTADQLYEKIQYFGSLYDFSIRDITKVLDLYRILEIKKDGLSKSYEEIMYTMLKLTPNCAETLVKCMWNGKEIKCNQLFRIQRTMVGFCCVFNSMRTSRSNFSTPNFVYEKSKLNTTVLTTAGYAMGLSVLVKSDLEDYYYPLLPMEGLSVFVFRPFDYPDMYSGGLIETSIPLQHEVFLKVEASKIYAVPELNTKTPKERGCVLDSDPDGFYRGGDLFDEAHYSYSNCISECKMHSILALCDCVPFFIPISNAFKFRKQACTLADTTCLNKYTDKWMTLYPTTTDEDFKFEQDNSITCGCLPACSFTEYDVTNDYTSLVDSEAGFLKGLDPRKHSLVHIYYDVEDTSLYKTDLYYYWFDQISNLGGLCGLFLGFSIISIIEFAYFFTIHYMHLLLKTRIKTIRSDSSVSKETNISVVEQSKSVLSKANLPLEDIW